MTIRGVGEVLRYFHIYLVLEHFFLFKISEKIYIYIYIFFFFFWGGGGGGHYEIGLFRGGILQLTRAADLCLP